MRVDPCPGLPARMEDEGAEGPLVIRELRLIFSSSPMAVRRALRSALGGLTGLDLTVDESATVELVLAEVLNNVVEHAYADQRRGMIELQIRHDSHGLICTVIDDGLPMPKETLPTGQRTWPTGGIQSLPEGGFGWVLIREMASDLAYRRDDGRNILSFRLEVGRTFRPS